MAQRSTPLLLDLFERGFVPHRLPGRCADYVGQFRKAIEFLGAALGREPTVDDLNASAIEHTLRAVAQAKASAVYLKAVRKKLMAVWRYADRLDVAAQPQRVPLPTSKKPRPAFLKKPAAADTLSAVFRDRLRPAMCDACVCQSAVNAAGKAIDRLNRHYGRYVRFDEVTDELLDDHAAWLRDNYAAAFVRVEPSTLRTLLRRLVPERFPSRRRLPPQSPAEPGTLRHFFETEYRPQRLIDCKPKSVESYRADLRRFVKRLGREATFADLTDATLADHFSWLFERGRSAGTVNNVRARLFALWRFAEERQLVDRRPRLRKFRTLRYEPDSWTGEQVGALIRAAREFSPRRRIGGVPANQWWTAALLIVWYTGLRRAALVGLKFADVDLSSGWLSVPPEAMKNNRGQKFRLGADAIEAIRAIESPGRQLILPLGCALEDATKALSNDFRRLLHAAGVAPSARKKMGQFHKLRRTTATEIAKRQGLAAASALLGHSSLDMTRRYVDPSKLPGADATAVLPPLAAERPEAIEPPEPPASLLDEADQLFALGYVFHASMTARIVLQRAILGECSARGLPAKKQLGESLLALRAFIEPATFDRLKRLVREANRPMHDTAIGAERTVALLASVRELTDGERLATAATT